MQVCHHDVVSSEHMALLHEDDCRELGVMEGDRVTITGCSSLSVLVCMSDTLVDRGVIRIPADVMGAVEASDGETVEVGSEPTPDSVRAIRRKMDGEMLTEDEICSIVDDVMSARLSRIETSAWLTALHIRGMCMDEIAAYTMAMSRSGDVLDFGDRRVLDFHSFGGIAGNKITPIVVSIVAAAGYTIPKLSSRAISSACGTADFVETFCDIRLNDGDIHRIAQECGGTFSWTGSTDLGPAGDVFIITQRPLGIDPRPQMLASIMGKKVAAGAHAMVMDIPTGPETKVRTHKEAIAYAHDLMELGDRIGIDVDCAITPALQPLGRAVGPILEARECMQVLEGLPGHEDVAEKAILCAGMLMGLGGDPDGARTARDILESGRAHAKFLEIVAAQGGNPEGRSTDLGPGPCSADVVAGGAGKVSAISNKAVIAIAKAAGAPADKGAGLLFHRKCGDVVAKGDVLFTVYAEKEDKLADAIETASARDPFTIGA